MTVKQLSLPGAALGVALIFAPAHGLTLKPGTLWPGPVIPVCWEDKSHRNKQERDLIRKSVKWTWERESAVRFTGWRQCRKGDRGVHISFESGYPRTAGRGVELDGTARGVLLPSLWSLAALSVNLKAPVHEFGHVLGFGHEYARNDAPNYEVCAAGTRAGRRYTEDDTPITPFDFDSIMVACLKGATIDFSRGTPKLSALDIFGLVQSYGSNPANVLDADEPGDRFGTALLVRDLDGDAVPDLLIGAPGEDGGAGAIYLYRGDRISGFRPWARVAGDHRPGFGTALHWVQEAGTESGVPVALAADGTAFTIRIAPRKKPVARMRSRSPAPTSPPARLQPPPLPLAYGFPRLTPRQSHVVADLDGDGNDDLVVGLPDGDARATDSGVVVVYQGMLKAEKSGSRFRPWYWFGQAY